jgi:hypothetical protein
MTSASLSPTFTTGSCPKGHQLVLSVPVPAAICFFGPRYPPLMFPPSPFLAEWGTIRAAAIGVTICDLTFGDGLAIFTVQSRPVCPNCRRMACVPCTLTARADGPHPYRNSQTSSIFRPSILRHRSGASLSALYVRAMAPAHMSASCTRRSDSESRNRIFLTLPLPRCRAQVSLQFVSESSIARAIDDDVCVLQKPIIKPEH